MEIAGYRISRETFWGVLSRFGWVFAAFAFLTDRLNKWYMLDVYDIADRSPVSVFEWYFSETTRFGFNLLMAWNNGVSYGLLASDGLAGRLFLITFSLILVIGLSIWLARVLSPVLAGAIGLVIGGALGNIYDRIVFGAVADFFHFYWNNFSWYIFNLADVWIVLGVLIMVYDSIFPFSEGKPRDPDEGETPV